MLIFYSIFFIYVYNIFISLFSFGATTNNLLPTDNSNSFTILIPCHNEENVIYKTLLSILSSSYKNYNVYIIADSCSDNTVLEANRFISEYRVNNTFNVIQVLGGSTPKALSKADLYLKNNNLWNDDCIVVVDADNRISPTLLSSFDKYMFSGEEILQARILSHNDNGLIAKGFTCAFNIMTESFQVARNRIGLSAGLCGTGFCIKKDLWDSIGFENCSTLAEDLEFTVLSILSGSKIKFIKEEYVLNQNLEDFKPSIVQRIRWARGYMQVSVKLSLNLIKAFFKKPCLQFFDIFVTINSPSRVMIYAMSNLIYFWYKPSFIPSWIILTLFLYNFIFVLYSNKFNFKYVFPYIFHTICTFFIVVYSVFTFRNYSWTKTFHKSID